MKTIYENEIEDEAEVCVYCMDERARRSSCCSEYHFEMAYVLNDELYLTSETVVLDGDRPLTDEQKTNKEAEDQSDIERGH